MFCGKCIVLTHERQSGLKQTPVCHPVYGVYVRRVIDEEAAIDHETGEAVVTWNSFQMSESQWLCVLETTE